MGSIRAGRVSCIYYQVEVAIVLLLGQCQGTRTYLRHEVTKPFISAEVGSFYPQKQNAGRDILTHFIVPKVDMSGELVQTVKKMK